MTASLMTVCVVTVPSFICPYDVMCGGLTTGRGFLINEGLCGRCILIFIGGSVWMPSQPKDVVATLWFGYANVVITTL